MARRSGRRSALLLPVLAVAVLAVIAACGAPEYHYVTNSEDRTYLRIPASWAPLDAKELGVAFGLDPTPNGPVMRQVWTNGIL